MHKSIFFNWVILFLKETFALSKRLRNIVLTIDRFIGYPAAELLQIYANNNIMLWVYQLQLVIALKCLTIPFSHRLNSFEYSAELGILHVCKRWTLPS